MASQRIIAAEGNEVLVLSEAMGAGLLANLINLAPCGRPMKWTVYGKVKDGFRWRCGICKRERTVRENSFFQESNVPIPKWIQFVDCWSRNDSFTVDDVRVAAGVSPTTAKSMLKVVREMCDRVAFMTMECSLEVWGDQWSSPMSELHATHAIHFSYFTTASHQQQLLEMN